MTLPGANKVHKINVKYVKLRKFLGFTNTVCVCWTSVDFSVPRRACVSARHAHPV